VALSATADNKSKNYGEANPPLTITYSGFVNGEGPGDITEPSISTTATTTSVPGTYPITLSGGSTSNYVLSLYNGTLTVNPADVTVAADLQFIYKGDPLPAFTSTITGLVPGGPAVVSGPDYSLSPNYNGQPNQYTITPSNLVFASPGFYNVSYVPNYLYVNPKGGGAKKIKPSLTCVDTLINDPSGFQYVAHMTWANDNNSTVYIPHGPDNYINATGSFSGETPEVFPPGSGSFDILFDGQALQWVITTYQGNQKSSNASDASSTSNKCNAQSRMTGTGGGATFFVNAYPNPAGDVVTLQTNGSFEAQDIAVYDIIGNRHAATVYPAGNDWQVSLKGLHAGVYFIRLSNGTFEQVVRLVKM
jgi:hypothetical protein